MRVYRGAILTCDAQDHVYKYLVEDQGRIAYTLKVEQLLLKGEPYQKIAQNPVGQVLRGLTRK